MRSLRAAPTVEQMPATRNDLKPHVLVATYPLADATPEEYGELCLELAPAFAAIRGLHSKTWLVNSASGRYGGIYLFESRERCDAFVASELFATLRGHSAIGPVEGRDYAVDMTASRLTDGVVSTRGAET